MLTIFWNGSNALGLVTATGTLSRGTSVASVLHDALPAACFDDGVSNALSLIGGNPSAEEGGITGIGKIALDLIAELVEPEIRPDRKELFFALHNRSFDRLFNLTPFVDESFVFRFKPGSDKYDRLLLKQRIAFLRPAELIQKRIDLSNIPTKRKHGYELLVDRLDERSIRREFFRQLFALSLLHASDSKIQILPLGFSEISPHLLHAQEGLVGDFLLFLKGKQGLSKIVENRPIRFDLGFFQKRYVQRAFPGKRKVPLL